MGIFGAGVDETLGRANGIGGDGHALDQHEGVALENHAVGECAAVALVGVSDHIFAVGARVMHGLPLDPGGKTGAAASAQAGESHLFDHFGRRQGQRRLQAFQAVKSAIIVERKGIGDADTGKSQALLAFEPVEIGNWAEA